MSGPLAVHCAVIFVVAMPVMLFLAMLQHLYVDRRKSKCAASAQCANRQKMLGQVSIERADLFWRDYMDERIRASEGAKLRIIRKVMAIKAPKSITEVQLRSIGV